MLRFIDIEDRETRLLTRRRYYFGDMLPKERLEVVDIDKYLEMDIQHVPQHRRIQKRIKHADVPEISTHKLNKTLKIICREYGLPSDFRRKEWRR